MLSGGIQAVTRGATIQFATTFYDVNGNVVVPDSANVQIFYATPAEPDGIYANVAMTRPGIGNTLWTALWDSRGALAPWVIEWAIQTGMDDPIPVTQEDGIFRLVANNANLPTF
jgi:hypothetical protein